jgi:hypothetical protein
MRFSAFRFAPTASTLLLRCPRRQLSSVETGDLPEAGFGQARRCGQPEGYGCGHFAPRRYSSWTASMCDG